MDEIPVEYEENGVTEQGSVTYKDGRVDLYWQNGDTMPMSLGGLRSIAATQPGFAREAYKTLYDKGLIPK